jgi:hypothetical protein
MRADKQPMIDHGRVPEPRQRTSHRRLRGTAKSVVLAATLALTAAAPAFADGPFEPNETATEATGPLTGATVTAALETPQDVDWYRFYAHPQRQVGVLATLGGSCARTSGTITVSLLDAEGSFGGNLGSLTLGWDYSTPNAPVAARNLAFTSAVGHRYFLKVTQSGCQNVPYSLQLAPADDLTSTLQDTAACSAAKRARQRAVGREVALRRAVKRAHGARRRTLRARLSLQRQAVAVARGNQASICQYRPLTSYPFT